MGPGRARHGRAEAAFSGFSASRFQAARRRPRARAPPRAWVFARGLPPARVGRWSLGARSGEHNERRRGASENGGINRRRKKAGRRLPRLSYASHEARGCAPSGFLGFISLEARARGRGRGNGRTTLLSESEGKMTQRVRSRFEPSRTMGRGRARGNTAAGGRREAGRDPSTCRRREQSASGRSVVDRLEWRRSLGYGPHPGVYAARTPPERASGDVCIVCAEPDAPEDPTISAT